MRAPRWLVPAACVAVFGCQDPPTGPDSAPATTASLLEPQVVPRLAFWGPNGKLYTVRSDGTGLIQIAQNSNGFMPRYTTWSPAGSNRIAFKLQVAVDTHPDVEHNYHVGTVGANGSGLLDLTPAGVDEVDRMAWSPDGSRIAFIARSGSSTVEHLMVVNADGTGLDTLASHSNPAAFPTVDAPAWSPDGSRIIYYSAEIPSPPFESIAPGIWSIKPDGTGRIKLRSFSENLRYVQLQFSPNGTRLLLCRQVDMWKPPELLVLNANGSGLVGLGINCERHGYGDLDAADWSPDGSRILTTHDGDLHTVSPNGGNLTQLTFDGTSTQPYANAQWSRQGTKIAYVRFNHSVLKHGGKLYAMAANGSSKKLLTPRGMEINEPTWGP